MFVFEFSVTNFKGFYSELYWWRSIFHDQIKPSSTLSYKQECKFEFFSLFLGIFTSQNHFSKNYSSESLGTHAIYNEIILKNYLFAVRF